MGSFILTIKHHFPPSLLFRQSSSITPSDPKIPFSSTIPAHSFIMCQRKAISKYSPPGFDANKIRPARGLKGAGLKARPRWLRAPISMRCTTYGAHIYKGRTFDARRTISDEKYLGIQIYRFYIRCPPCVRIHFPITPLLRGLQGANDLLTRMYDPGC